MVNNGIGISLEYDGNINITRPGKRLHNYGKTTMLLMDKSTISMAMFNSFLYVYQRVTILSNGWLNLSEWESMGGLTSLQIIIYIYI